MARFPTITHTKNRYYTQVPLYFTGQFQIIAKARELWMFSLSNAQSVYCSATEPRHLGTFTCSLSIRIQIYDTVSGNIHNCLCPVISSVCPRISKRWSRRFLFCPSAFPRETHCSLLYQNKCQSIENLVAMAGSTNRSFSWGKW